MSTSEIIIRTNNTFKSKDLTKATLGLADCFNSANKAYKDACVILAKVEANKSYKDDGFASLAEYAELIGLNKSAAHKMENAGRLILSDNPVIRDFAAKADYSKLSLLASEDEDEVAEAVEKGELTSDSTAANVKAWKASRPVKEGKEKVLPEYEVHIVFGNGRMLDIEKTALESIEALDGFMKVGAFKKVDTKPGSDCEQKETPWDVLVNPFTGEMARMYKVKAKADKKGKKSAPVAFDLSKLPDDIVAKMIAEYNAKREAGKGE